MRAKGKAKMAEEHGSVDKTSPSLKLPKQKSEGSRLPRKQLKKLLRQEADCCRYHLLKKKEKGNKRTLVNKEKKMPDRNSTTNKTKSRGQTRIPTLHSLR